MFNLSNIQFAFLISVLAGLTSLLGAFFVFAFKGLPLKRLALGLGFSAGIMFYVAIDELIPAAKRLGHGHLSILGSMLGVVFMFMITFLISLVK